MVRYSRIHTNEGNIYKMWKSLKVGINMYVPYVCFSTAFKRIIFPMFMYICIMYIYVRNVCICSGLGIFLTFFGIRQIIFMNHVFLTCTDIQGGW